MAVDARDAGGTSAFEPIFQLELALVNVGPPARTGGRALVRFEHGSAPLVQQVWQRLRQLLLRQLGL